MTENTIRNPPQISQGTWYVITNAVQQRELLYCPEYPYAISDKNQLCLCLGEDVSLYSFISYFFYENASFIVPKITVIGHATPGNHDARSNLERTHLLAIFL